MSVRVVSLLQSILSGVHQAGRCIVLQRQGSELNVRDKGKDNPQTEADRQAQRVLIHHLTTFSPSLHSLLVAEEEMADLDQKHTNSISNEEGKMPWEEAGWVAPWHSRLPAQESFDRMKLFIDPLDGTKEYIRGSESVPTVCVDNRPWLGVIHQPFLRRWLLGITGVGAFTFQGHTQKNFQPVPPCPVLPSQPLCGLITKHHGTPLMQRKWQSLGLERELREGGAGYKTLRLLGISPGSCGIPSPHLYVYPGPGMSLWDVCAAEACILSMNGKMTDIHVRAKFPLH